MKKIKELWFDLKYHVFTAAMLALFLLFLWAGYVSY